MAEAMEEIEDATPRRFRPYPKYRDSGLGSLGDIPVTWSVQRLKQLAAVQLSSVDKKKEDGEIPVRLCNYVDVYHNDVIKPEIDFMEASASSEEIRRLALAEGDVLITKDSETWDDIAVPAYVGPNLEGVVCGYHLAHIRPDPSRLLGGYLSRAFEAAGVRDQFRAAATGITRFGLSKRWIDGARFPVPPVADQQAISSFLDSHTAKIDALVAKKDQLIELLQEKRTALITRAVTQGIDPNVPMKDSGIEGMGELPAHWEVKRLWHLTPKNRRIMYGIVLPGPNVDAGVPIVKGGDVASARLTIDSLSKTTFEIEAGYVRSRLKGGDLVYAIRGSIGEVEMVPSELEGANLTQDAARIAYTDATNGRWLLYALRSPKIFAHLEARAVGATIKGINIRDLKRALIPVPPKEEQARIAEFLDEKDVGFERLATEVRKAIDCLREFRTALISAAVTGKIDVRGEGA